MTLERQWRRAIEKLELTRDCVVKYERVGAEPAEVEARHVRELSPLFDEILGEDSSPSVSAGPEIGHDLPAAEEAPVAPWGSAASAINEEEAPRLRGSMVTRQQSPAFSPPRPSTVAPQARPAVAGSPQAGAEPGYALVTTPTLPEFMLLALRRSFDFSGRSRRKEFWSWQLALVVSTFGVVMLAGAEIGAIFMAFALLPTWAVAVRRLHDGDHSGWWWVVAMVLMQIPVIQLIAGLALLAVMCLPGTTGPNRFGPDPIVN